MRVHWLVHEIARTQKYSEYFHTFGLCTRVLLSAKCALFSGDSRRFLAASRFSSFIGSLGAATDGFGDAAATTVALGCCEVALVALVTFKKVRWRHLI